MIAIRPAGRKHNVNQTNRCRVGVASLKLKQNKTINNIKSQLNADVLYISEHECKRDWISG